MATHKKIAESKIPRVVDGQGYKTVNHWSDILTDKGILTLARTEKSFIDEMEFNAFFKNKKNIAAVWKEGDMEYDTYKSLGLTKAEVSTKDFKSFEKEKKELAEAARTAQKTSEGPKKTTKEDTSD